MMSHLKGLLDLSLGTGRLAVAFWCRFSLESWSSLDGLLILSKLEQC
jgi:hypothetical protein